MKKNLIYFVGCSKCKKQFPRIPTENGGQKPDYSGFERDSWTPRTGREHKESAARTKEAKTDAERSNLESAGVRWTELFRLDYFCPIQNHLIDPLHCLYLGIARTMTKHYLKTELISKQHLDDIQVKMNEIRAPNTVGRIPQKIASGFSSFTADQWKNWTLVYSSSVLRNILDKKHYRVWMMFVNVVRMLTKKIVCLTDIRQADQLLVCFCKEVEKLYGAEFIKPNFHMACHLVKVMEEYGPVYSFWCYSFER